MQKLIISGNVGKDATVRETKEGNVAIGFSVAVHETYQKAGEKVETTAWYDCTIWRKKGQSTRIAEFLTAGQQVMVEGRPKAGGYQDKSNNWVPTIGVRVSDVELLGRKPEPAGEQQGSDESSGDKPADIRHLVGAFIEEGEDDLPF